MSLKHLSDSYVIILLIIVHVGMYIMLFEVYVIISLLFMSIIVLNALFCFEIDCIASFILLHVVDLFV
jgi:hypothetical protein